MADNEETRPTASPHPLVDDAEIEESVERKPEDYAIEEVTEPEVTNLDGANDKPDELPEKTPVLAASPTAAEAASRPEELEARIPAKKDATLREFLGKMDDYAPIIPDAVTNHYLTLAGLPPPPQTSPHLARLLALATQKFITDVAADAYQYARIRTSHTTSNTGNAMMGATMGLPGQAIPGAAGAPAAAAQGKVGEKGGEKAVKGSAPLGLQRPGFGGGGQGGGQGRTVLTMEDLGMAVGEYGVNVKRGEFYR